MSYDKRSLITISRIFDEDLFTEWELEYVKHESEEWWYFIFEYIGFLRGTDESVYICHDPQLRQSLLLSRRRSALWKKFSTVGMCSSKL